MSINVLIVDDDDLIKDSIKIVLDLEKDIHVAGTCKNGDEAYKQVLSDPAIDVILMDIRMPVCDGVLATKKIMQAKPTIKIILLTTFDDDDYIYEALSNGAKGYLLKTVTPEKIIESIHIVYQGNVLVHHQIAQKLPSVIQREKEFSLGKYGFSEVESDIIKLIAKGFTNKEIGERLFLGEGTIKNKTSQILNKLGLRDRTQLAIFYLNHGKLH